MSTAISAISQPPSSPLTKVSERLALWALRRGAEAPRACSISHGTTARWPGWELSRVVFALQIELSEIRQSIRLQFGCTGTITLTRDERRMLQALSAAQRGDDALVDNYLYKIALDRHQRHRLAAVINTLAAALAVEGHWLSEAQPGAMLPAAQVTSWR